MSACLSAPLSALPILIIGYQVQLVQCKCFAPPVDLVCLIVCLQLLSAQVKTAIGSFFVLSIKSAVCLLACLSAPLIWSAKCKWFILCPVDHVCLFVCLHFPSGWSVIKCNWFPASLSAPLISSSMSCQSFSDHLAYWLSNTGCNCFTKHFFFFT